MRWRKPPQGFPPIVTVTNFRTSPAARARRRAHYRRQCERNAIRFYNVPVRDAVIEALLRKLGIVALDKRSVARELARVLTETLTKHKM
jgi:hypothetical protein